VALLFYMFSALPLVFAGWLLHAGDFLLGIRYSLPSVLVSSIIPSLPPAALMKAVSCSVPTYFSSGLCL